MYPEYSQSVSPQPQLFLLEESIGTLELFPAVWSALEDLTSEESDIRLKGLAQIIKLNGARHSPVVAYILTTRITDPNIELRARIVEALSDVLSPDKSGLPAPEEVRNCVHFSLSGMRSREIYALLQVSAKFQSLEGEVCHLLNSNPYAGNHMMDILIDPKPPLEIRKQAALLIGRVGYLDTIPQLEKFAARLEGRLSGQKAMDFAPRRDSKELKLLPTINEALRLLYAP
ncbi:MAG: hypothetical protein JSV42_15970 [Chloroflexota bacterium]|nr:MAG: hypothetical protein JSV42_15970 [Chloroflexota bacterium]